MGIFTISMIDSVGTTPSVSKDKRYSFQEALCAGSAGRTGNPEQHDHSTVSAMPDFCHLVSIFVP